MRSQRICLLISVCLLCLFAAGCGRRTGTITGIVTWKDRPLADGSITVMAKGVPYSSMIEADGRYTITEVPEGPALATVLPGSTTTSEQKPLANPDAVRAGGKRAGTSSLDLNALSPDGKKNAFPMEYADFAATPLKFTVAAPTTQYDVKIP